MLELWNTLLVGPLVNILLILYHILFSNLGLAIIGLTALIKLVMLPLTLPSMRSMQQLKDLAPDLEKIKQKYKGDKTKLMQAQADFYKSHGVNPAAGCLPQLLQIVVLIALVSAFGVIASGNPTESLNKFAYQSLKLTDELNHSFLYLDLTRPDKISVPGFPFELPGPFLFFAAVIQFMSAKMMMPEAKAGEKIAKKTPGQADDFMASFQKQSLYMFPVLTIFAGYSFASGLVLYWAVLSLSQTIQQYFVSGWGGLAPWMKRLNLVKYTN